MFIRRLYRKINYLYKKIQQDFLKRKLLNFWTKNKQFTANSQTIIFWEFGGFSPLAKKDASIAIALNLRGYKTHFILCDGSSDACIQREIGKGKCEDWSNKCSSCLNSVLNALSKYPISYSFSKNYFNKEVVEKLNLLSDEIDLDKIKNYKYLNVNVGEYAFSSFLRYLNGYSFDYLEDNPNLEVIYRKYFFSSLLNTYITDQVIKKYKPVSFFMSHGVFVDYSPALFMAFLKGIKAVCWSGSYNGSFYYAVPENKDIVFNSSISDNEWIKRKGTNLSVKELERLNNFWIKRYFKKEMQDSLNFFDDDCDIEDLRKKLGIKNNNPIVCLFSHINLDVCFNFTGMIFEDHYSWVINSIKKMMLIEDVNWLIKVHPSEKVMRTISYGVLDEIKKTFTFIPPHIKIVKPDQKINTYSLFQLIDVGITMTGTVGVELACFGKSVITVARSHYSNKGFTLDPSNKEKYLSLFEAIRDIKRLDSYQIDLAKKYAYSYFIQRQIPLYVINKFQSDWGGLNLNKLNQLLPGKDPVLDKICGAIVNGTDVILDEEDISKLEKENLL